MKKKKKTKTIQENKKGNEKEREEIGLRLRWRQTAIIKESDSEIRWRKEETKQFFLFLLTIIYLCDQFIYSSCYSFFTF